ncbi:MAG: HTH domain-containing protein, partial [Telluria sp.]
MARCCCSMGHEDMVELGHNRSCIDVILPCMHQPTTRLLAVLELLQAQPRIAGAEIATRLGVELRTVRRYVATLEGMGIPITA